MNAHTCIDIDNAPTGLFCVACVERDVRDRENYQPPSLIDAAKQVESWWLNLDKDKHGFYGAPREMFSLRAAIEEHDRSSQPAPNTGEWRVEAMPTHGWRVVDATGQEIVADVYRKEDAEQIVSDHAAVRALREVVKDEIEALNLWREYLRNDDAYEGMGISLSKLTNVLTTLRNGGREGVSEG